jgi:hypothetical protein
MSLYSNGPNVWGWTRNTVAAVDTPSAVAGTIMAAIANTTTKSAWVSIGTYSSDDTTDADVYYTELYCSGNVASANDARTCLDIGVFYPGGADYTLVASNVLCGNLPPSGEAFSGLRIDLPLFIPSGSKLGARVSGENTAYSDQLRVTANMFGAPSRPEMVWAGGKCESIGIANDGSVPTNNVGTTVTPADNVTSWNTTIGTAEGNWHSLGTCTNRLRHLSLFMQLTGSSYAGSLGYHWALGYGDGTNVVTVIPKIWTSTSATERRWMGFGPNGMYCDIPAGSTIYVRGVCSGEPETTWTAMALGTY